MAFNRDTILRLVVCVHFVLMSLAFLSTWLPPSYYLGQCLILTLGLWSIGQRESALPVQMLMLIKFMTVFLDAIAIGLYFQLGRKMNEQSITLPMFNLSAAFAIILLIFKPIMLLLLNKVLQERESDPSFGNWAPPSGYISVDGR